VIALELKDNFQRAIFISTLSALLRQLKKVDNTRHCKKDGMRQSGRAVEGYINERYESPKIWLVGLQPGRSLSITHSKNSFLAVSRSFFTAPPLQDLPTCLVFKDTACGAGKGVNT
jgi:hypothetical protein